MESHFFGETNDEKCMWILRRQNKMYIGYIYIMYSLLWKISLALLCYEDGVLMGFGLSLTDKHPVGFGWLLKAYLKITPWVFLMPHLPTAKVSPAMRVHHNPVALICVKGASVWN